MIIALSASLMAFQTQADVRSFVAEGYALTGVLRGGRSPVNPDPIHYRLVRAEPVIPIEGVTVPLADGRSSTWKTVHTGPDNSFNPAMSSPAISSRRSTCSARRRSSSR